jgi:1-phosphofructokinase family hexose kinase
VILTVTPNPSVDVTLDIPTLVRGAVHRITGQHQEPSGKGVNVTRALTRNGVSSVAVLPVGGAEGAELERLLRAEQVTYVAVPVAGSVRMNISLTELDGTATKVNAPGPTLHTDETDALLAAAAAGATDMEWVLGSGSLPPGIPADFYARLGIAVRASGARFALDSSGAALLAGLPAAPDVIKPNVEELAEVVGRPLSTVGDAAEAARELIGLGAGSVVVSLGPDGALLVDDVGVLHAEASVPDPKSTVGAGDALLAGFLAGSLQRNSDRALALREAVAWGSAAVRVAGSHVPVITDADRQAVVLTTEPELDRTLR